MIERTMRAERRRDAGERGFTLIELLVVVVILGILVAIAVPLYLNNRRGANEKAAQSDLRGAIANLEQCMTDNNKYPSAISSTGALTDCAGQSAVSTSAGTVLTYAQSGQTAYTMFAKNSGGAKTFCFSSAKGGQVKSSGSATSTYSDTCPAA